MYTSQLPTNPLLRVIAIAFGVIVGLAVFAALLFGGDAGYVDQSRADYAVSGASATGSGDTQFYDGGSITTTDDGELIYSDTSGSSFSSGG